jgi:hypothetical protein
MRALLCHCRHHLEAEDDDALCVAVREHLIWSLPNNRCSRSSRPAPTTSSTPRKTLERSWPSNPTNPLYCRPAAGGAS